MRYWLFHNNQVTGPFDRDQIAQLSGFSAESLVCPEGRKGTQMGDWMRASTVPDLTDAIARSSRVPALVRAAGERAGPAAGGLPPEPTLRDLAVLGSLQEKVEDLSDNLRRLQDDLKARDAEISRLKSELEQKGRAASDLGAKLSEVEAKVFAVSGVKEELEKTQAELRGATSKLSTQDSLIRDLQDKLERQARSFAPPPVLSPMSTQPMSPLVSPAAPALETPAAEPPLAKTMMGRLAAEGGAPENLLASASEPAAETATAESPKKTKKSPLFLFVLIGAGAVTGTLYYLGQQKPKPPQPVKEEAATPVPLPEAQPDLSQEAIHTVKARTIVGKIETVGQLLETRYPPTGKLSPWMVEKLSADRYQVHFYASQSAKAPSKAPVFEFQVDPKAQQVQGLNKLAVALLMDGSLPSADGKIRSRRRRKGQVDLAGEVLSGIKKGGQQLKRAKRAAQPASDQLVGEASAPPAAAAPGGSDAPPQPQGKEGEESSLDQLLLPGLEKPAGNPSSAD